VFYEHVRPPFWRRHPALTCTVALMTGWWIANGWYEALAVTGAAAVLMFVGRRRRAHAVRDAGLRARADYEHRLNVAGAPRGMYGRYPPIQPGWFPDPANRCQMRYFDGAAWTRHAIRR